MSLDAVAISERIKSEIKKNNFKQKDIYEKADISHTAMSRYVNGTRIPDTESMLKIANALNVSIEYLLTGEDKKLKLPDQEEKLLDLFRQLSPEDKIKIFGYLEAKLPDPDAAECSRKHAQHNSIR